MIKTNELERIKERLDRGIKEVMTSGKFQEWLKFLAGFHDYSFKNTILIFSQNPQATLVKGFHAWKKDGRFVKKGEKAIKILAPLVRKRRRRCSASAAPACLTWGRRTARSSLPPTFPCSKAAGNGKGSCWRTGRKRSGSPSVSRTPGRRTAISTGRRTTSPCTRTGARSSS